VIPRKTEAAPWVELFARIGFIAKGLLYATVGTLAACAGMGKGGGTTDTRGAMAQLLDLPFGRVLLIAMAIGLVGYAVWRFVEGVADADQRGNDPKAIAVRSSFVIRGLIHLWLAWAAVRAAMGHPDSGGGGKQKEAAAKAFTIPHGQLLLGAIAIGLAAFGAYQLYRAFAAKLSRDVDESQAEQETGRWILVVSRIGIGARGIVFMAIGWLLFRASRDHDPSKAGGIADALNALAQLGSWVFLGVAAGLIAYGIYQFLSARYRRIRAA
jgi:hypothetical protein